MHELDLRHIPFRQQLPFGIQYKTKRVDENRLVIVVADSFIVELKAVDQLAPIHSAQVISYLKATGLRLGLLINFNVAILKDGLRRIVL
jgi:GxxExxY protein